MESLRSVDGGDGEIGLRITARAGKLEIVKPDGGIIATWELLAPDRVRQVSGSGGRQSEMKLARDNWR